MDTKLTLNVDQSVIVQAKEYAKMHKISLSRLIESYLSSLVDKKENNSEIEITPLVKSLSGVVSIKKEEDLNRSYTDFLIEKYK